MLIIIDKKIPTQAKLKLQTYGELLELDTSGITYDAISGHPDIFFCQILDNSLIVAPNLPDKYYNTLSKHNITFVKGEKSVGLKYPFTAHYNAVVTNKYLIHNLNHTDKSIPDYANHLTHINTKQAYTRCNLLNLGGDSFITSDEGIYRTLVSLKINVLYVSPEGIELPGFNHGFIGGACGVYKDSVFIIGSLNYHKQGDKIRGFIKEAGFKLIELYEGNLFDGGSLLFVE